MNRYIKPAGNEYAERTLDFVEAVFRTSEGEASGRFVRNLVAEIRSKRFYLPTLDLVMVDEDDRLLGYAMFSRFHLQGTYEDELLLLSPVAVKTEFQRRHISKHIIEYGFARAVEAGFKAVIVEGNPDNYRSRGFKTARDFGITAGESVELPAPECLMVKELVPGALQTIRGVVEYSDYEALR